MTEKQEEYAVRDEENRFILLLTRIIYEKMEFYSRVIEYKFEERDCQKEIENAITQYLSFFISERGKKLTPEDGPEYRREFYRLKQKFTKRLREHKARTESQRENPLYSFGFNR